MFKQVCKVKQIGSENGEAIGKLTYTFRGQSSDISFIVECINFAIGNGAKMQQFMAIQQADTSQEKEPSVGFQ